jgi:phosphoglycerate kinase
MPAFRTLDDVSVTGKKVVIRLDLNVPMENGTITDTTRIDRVVPTLKELLDKGAAIIILAHFDRPKGKVVPEMSLKPIAPALASALGHPVHFHFTDWQSAPHIHAKPGDVILMENTRYHAGEEKNDEGFAKLLGGLGDISSMMHFQPPTARIPQRKALPMLFPPMLAALCKQSSTHSRRL